MVTAAGALILIAPCIDQCFATHAPFSEMKTGFTFQMKKGFIFFVLIARSMRSLYRCGHLHACMTLSIYPHIRPMQTYTYTHICMYACIA